jgi:hypothetical protein
MPRWCAPACLVLGLAACGGGAASTTDDGGHDDAGHVTDAGLPDAMPLPACGDGVRSRGELCLPLLPADPRGAAINIDAVGDLDGDGRLDLAGLDVFDGLTVYWGGDHGQFLEIERFDRIPAQIIGASDLDGDGRDELLGMRYAAIPNSPWLTFVEQWRVHRGGSTETLDSVQAHLDDDETVEAHLADLDTDGDLDLLVNLRYTARRQVWLRNDAGRLTYVEPLHAVVRAVLDVDHDADMDLVNQLGPDSAEIVYNEGPALFFDSVPLEVGHLVDYHVLDTDGDGHDELVTLTSANDQLELYRWDDAGQLSRSTWPMVLGPIHSFSPVGDLDGRPGDELVLTATLDGEYWNQVITFDATDEPTATLLERGNPRAIADLDRDGLNDLIGESSIAGDVAVVFGGLVGRPDLVPARVGPATGRLLVLDWDGDGDDDLLDTGRTDGLVSGVLHRLRRTGPASFEPAGDISLLFAHDVAPGDLDGDGDVDLALAFNPGGVLRNDGSGGFTQVQTPFAIGTAVHVATADVDADGTDEFLVTVGDPFGTLPRLLLYARVGDGWAVVRDVDLSGLPTALTAADVDGDGRPEAVVATDDQLVTVIGLGDPLAVERVVSLQMSPDFATVADRLDAVDLDGDGCREIFAFVTGAPFTLGCADAPLVPAWIPASAEILDVASDAAFVDLDDDGDLDLVVGDHARGSLGVLINDGGELTRVARYRIPGRIVGPVALEDSIFLLSTETDLELVVPAP